MLVQGIKAHGPLERPKVLQRCPPARLLLGRAGPPSSIGAAGMPHDRPRFRWPGNDGPAHKSTGSPLSQPMQDNVAGSCCSDEVIAPVGLARAIYLGSV
jgi:hypothetical protein